MAQLLSETFVEADIRVGDIVVHRWVAHKMGQFGAPDLRVVGVNGDRIAVEYTTVWWPTVGKTYDRRDLLIIEVQHSNPRKKQCLQ